MLRFETIDKIEQNRPVSVKPIEYDDMTPKKPQRQLRRETHRSEERIARGKRFRIELLSTGMSEETARELMYHLYKGKRRVIAKLIHRVKARNVQLGISRGTNK